MKVQKKVYDFVIIPLFTIFICVVSIMAGFAMLAFTGEPWSVYATIPLNIVFTVYAFSLVEKYIDIYY